MSSSACLLSGQEEPFSVPAIRMENVSFAHDREPVLEDVCLTVQHGDFLAVLGPNGGGKTTLLRLLLGFSVPDAGSVRIFGVKPENARAHIGYVPQFSAIRQDFPATVLQTALMGAACPVPDRGVVKTAPLRSLFRKHFWSENAAAKKRALVLLDQLGIADIATHHVGALSGGQRQRLMVARALMGRSSDRPFLLLLDEPTASIDQEGKWCFYEFLASLRREITIVVVSHELAMASPFFTHVALVNKTLTLLPKGAEGDAIMRAFIGPHGPDCPVTHAVRSPCACTPGSDNAKGKGYPHGLARETTQSGHGAGV